MVYQRFSLGPQLTAHDWPLKLAHGVMSSGLQPDKDFVLTTSAAHDYFFGNQEDRIQYAIAHADLMPKDGSQLSAVATEDLDRLIVATYHEGVELYRVLGKEFTSIKLASVDYATTSTLRKNFVRLSADQLTDEYEDMHRQKLERDGGNTMRRQMPKSYNMNEEHFAGCLHVIEMMQAMRAQASAALLAEEGVMGQAESQKMIDQSSEFLAGQGHAGPYALAKAHPAIDTFLRADKRQIVVQYARGREAFADVATTSHFTRGAYFNSEESHLDTAKWVNREEYLRDNTYPQAMGEWYLKAFQEKMEAVNKASRGHVLGEHNLTFQSLRDLPSFTGADSLEYDTFKRTSRQYLGKHGLALMQPEIINILDKAGKFTPMNSFALDHAFHHGYHPPYLTHIHDLSVRLNGVAKAATATEQAGSKPLLLARSPLTLAVPDKKPWGVKALENRSGKGREPGSS